MNHTIFAPKAEDGMRLQLLFIAILGQSLLTLSPCAFSTPLATGYSETFEQNFRKDCYKSQRKNPELQEQEIIDFCACSSSRSVGLITQEDIDYANKIKSRKHVDLIIVDATKYCQQQAIEKNFLPAFRKATYQRCINNNELAVTSMQLRENYCECTSAKIVQGLSPEDIADIVKGIPGQNSQRLVQLAGAMCAVVLDKTVSAKERQTLAKKSLASSRKSFYESCKHRKDNAGVPTRLINDFCQCTATKFANSFAIVDPMATDINSLMATIKKGNRECALIVDKSSTAKEHEVMDKLTNRN